MTADPPAQVGEPVSDADVQRLQALQRFLDPAADAGALDTYAKWLFTSAIIVGALATGLGTTGLVTAGLPGKIVFALAIVCVGTSLARAARSLSPQEMAVNPNSQESIETHINSEFKRRLADLRSATWWFALAIVLASLVPIAGGIDRAVRTPTRAVRLVYTVSDTGPVLVSAIGVHLRPTTVVRLEAKPYDPKDTTILPGAQDIADSLGAAKAAITLVQPTRRGVRYLITGRWSDGDAEQTIRDTIELPVLAGGTPPPKNRKGAT